MAQENVRRRNVVEESSSDQRERLLRPPAKTCRQKTRDFFWDKEKQTCLTRTPSNWLAISFYYVIFLAVVFLIFYISMEVSQMAASTGEDRPQYILGDSPIGSSPSINFFPLIDSRNLIWLSPNRTYVKYVNRITDIFNKYKKANKKFNSTIFGECSSPPFGYDTKTPCIFFRLNRLLMWVPAPYEKDDQIPETVPDEVQNLIKTSETPKLWFTCNGTTAKDRDHITQDFFQIIGEKGFDVSAFPYKRQKNYLDAIVPMKLKDSKPKNVLYSFTCTVWAKEIQSHKAGVDVVYYIE